jgi:hypothetical protein
MMLFKKHLLNLEKNHLKNFFSECSTDGSLQDDFTYLTAAKSVLSLKCESISI